MPLIHEWVNPDDPVDEPEDEPVEQDMRGSADLDRLRAEYQEGFAHGQERAAQELGGSFLHAMWMWFLVGCGVGVIFGGGCLMAVIEDKTLTMGPVQAPPVVAIEEASGLIHGAVEEALGQTPHRLPREE